MASSAFRRALAGAVLLAALAAPRRADAEIVFGPLGAVTTASARADAVGVGAYGETNSGSWLGMQGWIMYFPGDPGTYAAAVEGVLMAPLTGFGIRVRPYLGVGVAATHDRVDLRPDAAQPVFSVGALWYLSEKFALSIAGHNGVLGHNDSTRDSRSWSATIAVGRRF
jgi:hypothetical protein